MVAEQTMLSESRWNGLLAAFGIREEAATYRELVSAYSQKHRHYHTVKHIEHCLREFDAARALAREPAEVELALWFHDAPVSLPDSQLLVDVDLFYARLEEQARRNLKAAIAEL